MRTNLRRLWATLLLVIFSSSNLSPAAQPFMVSLSNHTLRATGLEESKQKGPLERALLQQNISTSGLEEAVVLDATVPYQYAWRTNEFNELWPAADDRDPKLARFERLYNQPLDGHPEGDIQNFSPDGVPEELARWVADNGMTPERVSKSIEWIHKMHPYDRERFISLQQLPSIQRFLAAHPEARFNLIGVREDKSKVGSFKIGQYMDEYRTKILKADHPGEVNFPGAVMYSSGNAIQGDVETLAWLKEQGLVPQDFKITMVAMKFLKPKKRKMIDEFKARKLVDEIVDPNDIAQEYLADLQAGTVPDNHKNLAVDPVTLEDINQVLKLLDWWSEKHGRAHIYASNSLSAVVGGARIYDDVLQAFTQGREHLQALLGADAWPLPAQPDVFVMPAAGGGPFGGIPFRARQLGHATKTIGPMPTIRTASIAEGLGIQMIQELARNLARLLGTNQMQLTEVSERAILKAFVELHDAGIEVEPSSAIAYAQVLYLMENKPEFFSQFLAENKRPMTLVAILTGHNFEPSDVAWAWAKVEELRLKEPHALRADPTQRQPAVSLAKGLQQVVVLSSGTEQTRGKALRQAVIDWRAQPENPKPTVTTVANPPKNLKWLIETKPDVILVAATPEEAQQDGLLKSAITVLGDAGIPIRYVPFPGKVAKSLNPLVQAPPQPKSSGLEEDVARETEERTPEEAYGIIQGLRIQGEVHVKYPIRAGSRANPIILSPLEAPLDWDSLKQAEEAIQLQEVLKFLVNGETGKVKFRTRMEPAPITVTIFRPNSGLPVSNPSGGGPFGRRPRAAGPGGIGKGLPPPKELLPRVSRLGDLAKELRERTGVPVGQQSAGQEETVAPADVRVLVLASSTENRLKAMRGAREVLNSHGVGEEQVIGSSQIPLLERQLNRLLTEGHAPTIVLLSNSIPIADVQQMLGHKFPSATIPIIGFQETTDGNGVDLISAQAVTRYVLPSLFFPPMQNTVLGVGIAGLRGGDVDTVPLPEDLADPDAEDVSRQPASGLEEKLLTVPTPPSQPVWLTAEDGIQLLERLLGEGESRSIYSVRHRGDLSVPHFAAVVSKVGGVIKVGTVGKLSFPLQSVMVRAEGYFIVKPNGNIFVIDAEDAGQKADVSLRGSFPTVSVDSLAPAPVLEEKTQPNPERVTVPETVDLVEYLRTRVPGYIRTGEAGRIDFANLDRGFLTPWISGIDITSDRRIVSAVLDEPPAGQDRWGSIFWI